MAVGTQRVCSTACSHALADSGRHEGVYPCPIGIHQRGTAQQRTPVIALSSLASACAATHRFDSVVYKTMSHTWAVASICSTKFLNQPRILLDVKKRFNSCIQPLLALWLADGPLPMRNMGAQMYDSGGRNVSKYI